MQFRTVPSSQGSCLVCRFSDPKRPKMEDNNVRMSVPLLEVNRSGLRDYFMVLVESVSVGYNINEYPAAPVHSSPLHCATLSSAMLGVCRCSHTFAMCLRNRAARKMCSSTRLVAQMLQENARPLTEGSSSTGFPPSVLCAGRCASSALCIAAVHLCEHLAPNRQGT